MASICEPIEPDRSQLPLDGEQPFAHVSATPAPFSCFLVTEFACVPPFPLFSAALPGFTLRSQSLERGGEVEAEL